MKEEQYSKHIKGQVERAGGAAGYSIEMSRRRRGETVYDRQRIFELRDTGLSQVEIAAEIGCSQALVSHVLGSRRAQNAKKDTA